MILNFHRNEVKTLFGLKKFESENPPPFWKSIFHVERRWWWDLFFSGISLIFVLEIGLPIPFSFSNNYFLKQNIFVSQHHFSGSATAESPSHEQWSVTRPIITHIPRVQPTVLPSKSKNQQVNSNDEELFQLHLWSQKTWLSQLVQDAKSNVASNWSFYFQRWILIF